MKKAPGKERKTVVRGNNSVLAKDDALQPSSEAANLTPEAELKKPLASATQKFVSPNTYVTKGNTLSSDHSPVSGIRAEKDRTEIASRTEINGDDRSLSRSDGIPQKPSLNGLTQMSRIAGCQTRRSASWRKPSVVYRARSIDSTLLPSACKCA